MQKVKLQLVTNLGHDRLVQLDKSRTQQVFINLISNAIKVSPENSEISVFVYLKDVDHLKAMIGLEVTDQGPGVSPEDRVNIFKPYFTKAVNGQNGQGLGLSISLQIAEKLGGSLRLEETDNGRGSLFIFKFPVLRPIYGLQQVYKFARLSGDVKVLAN